MKRIVRACIDEVLRFDNRAEADMFVHKLRQGRRKFRLESVAEQGDGSVLVHVKRQYNNAELSD